MRFFLAKKKNKTRLREAGKVMEDYIGSDEFAEKAEELLKTNEDECVTFASNNGSYTIGLCSEEANGFRGLLNKFLKFFGLKLCNRHVTVIVNCGDGKEFTGKYKFSGKKDFRKKILQAYDESKKANFKAILGNLKKINTVQELGNALNDKIFQVKNFNLSSQKYKCSHLSAIEVCKRSGLEKQMYADAREYLQTLKEMVVELLGRVVEEFVQVGAKLHEIESLGGQQKIKWKIPGSEETDYYADLIAMNLYQKAQEIESNHKACEIKPKRLAPILPNCYANSNETNLSQKPKKTVEIPVPVMPDNCKSSEEHLDDLLGRFASHKAKLFPAKNKLAFRYYKLLSLREDLIEFVKSINKCLQGFDRAG
ncbi:MAG: hypothetical protein LBI81_03455 [Puniceicoccales bacterium]|jgi:hypothetical protein|nr:hypothetical protein [Puniceicoccales bacterium]